MDKGIIYSSVSGMSVYRDGKSVSLESEYVNRFKNTVIKQDNKDKWKFDGPSAQFQGRMAEEKTFNFSINGIAPCDENSFYYTVSSGEASGIYNKDMVDQSEQYLVHSNNKTFYGLDYDKSKKLIAASVSDESVTKDLALFDIEKGDINIVTSGDSLDENPSFSKTGSDILFNSRGIARSKNLDVTAVGESEVYAFGIYSGDIREVASEKGYDLILPKNDKEGNLYYIRKPHTNVSAGGGNLLLDIILLPIRLIVGIGKLLLFLSKLSSKDDQEKTGISGGDTPSRFREASERDLFIYEETINAQKEEKKNAGKGIKNAGYAPYRFELYKTSKDGQRVKLANSVLSYDVDADGNIVYTNGKYIISLKKGGIEEVILKDKLITSVRYNQ